MPNTIIGNSESYDRKKELLEGYNAGLEGNMNVRLGHVHGVERAMISGFHLGVDSTTERLLSPKSLTTGVVDYTYDLSAATTMRLVSTSANDIAGGTGARIVYIEGLNSAYNPIQESIIMNGQTPVATTKQYIAINRMDVVSAGSSRFNEGDIFITDNVDSTTLGIPDNIIFYGIEAEWSTGHTGRYTVRRGYSAAITWYASSAEASSSSPNITCGKVFVQDSDVGDGMSYNLACLTLDRGYGQFNLFNAPVIPEKSTIYITTKKGGGAGSQMVGVYWHFNLINNIIHPDINFRK